jgi:Leucine-rich repeat (LRR) protein
MSALKIELKGVCEDNSVFRRLVNAHETNLNLGWQKLKSLDGATLSQLSHLKTLLLQFNSLSAIPSDIGKLTDLLELALYRNELEALPAEVGQLVSLEKLWLNDNKLAALPPTICRPHWSRSRSVSVRQLPGAAARRDWPAHCARDARSVEQSADVAAR